MLWNITLPLLFVFGADQILWQGTINNDIYPPFKKNRMDLVVDKHDTVIPRCDEMPSTMRTLQNEGVKVAVVSHSKEVNETEHLLSLFGYDRYISYKALGPETTMPKMKKLFEESGIEYYRTIFLDRKIAIFRDLQNLGMTCLNCLECGSENIVMGCIRIFRQKEVEK